MARRKPAPERTGPKYPGTCDFKAGTWTCKDCGKTYGPLGHVCPGPPKK